MTSPPQIDSRSRYHRLRLETFSPSLADYTAVPTVAVQRSHQLLGALLEDPTQRPLLQEPFLDPPRLHLRWCAHATQK
jgi:hypothetical protein